MSPVMSVFRVPEVTLLTHVPSTSVLRQATKGVPSPLVKESFREDIS
jgi:hypothetical protein